MKKNIAVLFLLTALLTCCSNTTSSKNSSDSFSSSLTSIKSQISSFQSSEIESSSSDNSSFVSSLSQEISSSSIISSNKSSSSGSKSSQSSSKIYSSSSKSSLSSSKIYSSSSKSSLSSSASSSSSQKSSSQSSSSSSSLIVTQTVEYVKNYVGENTELSDIEFTIKVTIDTIHNATYGNMEIFDDTGYMYLYGLYDSNGNRYDQMEDAPTEGDTIIVKGRAKYYSSFGVEMYQGVLVKGEPTPPTPVTTITKTITSLPVTFSYSSGNAGTTSSQGISFAYNRAVECYDSTGFISLLGQTNTISSMVTPGAKLVSTSSLGNVVSISVTYTSSSSFKLILGVNNHLDVTETVPASSSSYTTKKYSYEKENNYGFFGFESGTSKVSISKIEVECYSTSGESFEEASYNGWRINPTKYKGTLVSGSSYVDVPITASYNESTKKYTVTKTKRYTYYNYDYVTDSNKNQAAQTDPIDIINYYIAFGEFPANYQYNDNWAENYSKFGSLARQVSQYSSTGGYAQSVPFKGGYYYELDIDLDGSYAASGTKAVRGPGRVVVFDSGFYGTGYDDNPVCVYTDDHYATFAEYFNNGLFSERFSGNPRQTGQITDYVWSLVVTATL